MLKLKDKLFYGYALTWTLGLWIPYVYALFIWNIKQLFVNRHDIFLQILLFFFLIQIFSLSLGVFGEQFTMMRWIASLHNSVVFLFLCIGYVGYKYSKVDYLKLIRRFVPFFLLIALVSVLYFFLTESALIISTWWSKAIFIVDGLPGEAMFPRLFLFTPYPNAVAIMLFISFFLYIFKLENLNWIIILAFLASMFFTGSRMVTLLSLGLILLLCIKSPKLLRWAVVTLVAGIVLVLITGVYEVVLELRPGSNSMRLRIYDATWDMWVGQGLVFGIGLKPYIEGIPYPLGSHSSLLGYFFRTGIIGGSMYAIFMLFMLWTVFKDIFKMLQKKYFSHKHLIVSYSIGAMLIIYLLEDLDAFEVNAFLTGVLFSLYFEERRKWKEQVKEKF